MISQSKSVGADVRQQVRRRENKHGQATQLAQGNVGQHFSQMLLPSTSYSARKANRMFLKPKVLAQISGSKFDSMKTNMFESKFK